MTVFFTSDLHLQHRAMAWMRNAGHWPTDEERHLVTPEIVANHDAMLAVCWDKTVKADDVVWVLGDMIANPKHLFDSFAWIRDRPGQKHLILGNHDPAHPMNRDSHKYLHSYFGVFKSVQTMARRKIAGRDVLLSHFPYDGDGDGREDRASQYRLRNEGLPLLHGHVHSKDKLTKTYSPTNGEFPLVPQIHVGVDAWDSTPVPLEVIAELLSAAS